MKFAVLLFLMPMAAFAAEKSLADLCFESLKALPGKSKDDALKTACSTVAQLPECVSEEGVKIYHYNHAARSEEKEPKKILVFSLIHGDEFPSGSVARSWMERLTVIDPRNNWRVVPILNPDGLKKKTRMNVHGIDLNRNFPTSDWEKEAIKYWETKTKKDPRRFPGNKAGSEKETLCAIAHIDDFKPDLILSIHTPYGVLDFDGPKISPPLYRLIPWKSLGNYPGSLGRYMWVDRSKPILTIELKDKGMVEKLEQFDRLQDITGDVVIKTEKELTKKPTAKPSPKK
jgi:hypothetical protein